MNQKRFKIDIKGYEQLYTICSDGTIMRETNRKYVKTFNNKVKLYKNGIPKCFSVPRLVITNFAKFFPDDSYYVKHLEKCKYYNSLENLVLLKKIKNPSESVCKSQCSDLAYNGREIHRDYVNGFVKT